MSYKRLDNVWVRGDQPSPNTQPLTYIFQPSRQQTQQLFKEKKMQDVIIGKYRLSKTENFDAFLAEIGLGYIKRKLAQSTSPEITISRDGDRWTMVTSSALSTSQVSFVLGEDFAEDRQDGVSVTSRVTADDSNTWTQTQKPGDGKDVTIVREFGDKELKVTSTVNGVTAHRVYVRV
ncbi:Fatty acid-binding protein [Beauveria bassiana]|nr:Fatty acid-binding protein [Beauveria bassiana]